MKSIGRARKPPAGTCKCPTAELRDAKSDGPGAHVGAKICNIAARRRRCVAEGATERRAHDEWGATRLKANRISRKQSSARRVAKYMRSPARIVVNVGWRPLAGSSIASPDRISKLWGMEFHQLSAKPTVY